jgi:hypothetical protein
VFGKLVEAVMMLALWIRGVAMGDRVVPKEGPRELEKTIPAAEPEPLEVADAPKTRAAREAAIAALARQAPTQPLEDLGATAPPSRDAWIAAMLEEHGIENGTARTGVLEPSRGPSGHGTGGIAGRGSHLLPGERIALIALRGNPDEETLRALRAFPMHEAVPGTPEYRELVHGVFDRAKLRLLQRLAEEDLFPYAVRQWKPGPQHRQNNLEIVHAVHARLGTLMGGLFDFDPAPLGSAVGLPATLHACYDEKRRELFLGVRHLNGSLADLMEALAHQQVHCMQHQYIDRAEHPEALQPLVAAWRADFKQWGQTCRPLGIGYHAIDLGRSVGRLFSDLAVREGIK